MGGEVHREVRICPRKEGFEVVAMGILVMSAIRAITGPTMVLYLPRVAAGFLLKQAFTARGFELLPLLAKFYTFMRVAIGLPPWFDDAT